MIGQSQELATSHISTAVPTDMC